MINYVYRGLKVFLFYLSVLSLCRLVFCLWLQEYWAAGSGWGELQTALWLGTRLSIQTAGVLTLAVVVPAGICTAVSKVWGQRLERAINGFLLTATSVLFVASFPYYRQFHSRFHQLLFNAGNDDMYALLVSLVQEFNLPVRLAGALLLGGALWWLLYRLIGSFGGGSGRGADRVTGLQYEGRLGSRSASGFGVGAGRKCRLALLAVGLYVLGRLVVFGGSWGWETALEWENVGVTNDAFMNEAILDDYQAIYRGYRMNNRLLACNGLNFTAEQIKLLAAARAGLPPDSDNLDSYLRRSAGGAVIEKPQQIFLIVSESYANWPLLDKYADLHIADGMRGLIAEEDSDYCPAMLPNGASTISALTGVVTGLADANLYLTTMPESFAAPYVTALAPQMERLGYETAFWYAGPASWERIGAFTRAQGFGHFYGRGDMPEEAEGSVWGCDDEYLYDEVLKRVRTDTASFNVIMNASNHSPYSVDVAGKGFDAEAVRRRLPEAVQGDDWLLRELGHYWYADREMARFVAELKKRYPDCLIMLVGDHADRYNIDKTPSMYERYVIPFIVTGRGVHKGTLLPDSAGSQIDIGPTLIELIAPKGFEYYAVGGSLSRDNRQGVNYGFWITRDFIGEADRAPLEPVRIEGSQGRHFDEALLQQYIDTVRSVSWWRPKYGPVLDERLLEGW